MSTTGWVWAVVAVIIIGLGAWWFVTSGPMAAPAAVERNTAAGNTPSNTPAASSPQGDTGMQDNGVVSGSAGATVGAAPMNATITYTAKGFTPNNVIIAKGGTVTWVDQAGTPMWVASDVHPTHTNYDGTSRTQHCAQSYSGPAPFDECGTGTQYSFTFAKTGTFTFHNHAAANFTGTVVVQ